MVGAMSGLIVVPRPSPCIISASSLTHLLLGEFVSKE